MPAYYRVCHRENSDPPYPCGPQDDAEAAIMHFNTYYGPTVSKTFTTLPTGTSCPDYTLIEQERRLGGDGQHGSIHDIRSIRLYETTHRYQPL